MGRMCSVGSKGDETMTERIIQPNIPCRCGNGMVFNAGELCSECQRDSALAEEAIRRRMLGIGRAGFKTMEGENRWMSQRILGV